MIIGLTGKYCAGKNSAAEILETLGCKSIDVDKLGHAALENNSEKIRDVFGERVMNSDRVDRRALGELVFSDPAELERLESIVHPWMKEETARLAEEYSSGNTRHVIINAAILHKMKLDELCDCIIWIDAPLPVRIARAVSRDSAGIIETLKRIYAQKQLKPKPSAISVDIYRVGNGSGRNRLNAKIAAVLDSIEQKG